MREVKRTVNNIRTPSYSFGEIHKLIPANEATKEKGKIQEASNSTAVANDDDVAGEDTKIKRPKAETVKEVNLGVGHLATDSPLDTKVKKQLENLKSLIKGDRKPDYLDLDKDGNTEEPMSEAAKDIENMQVGEEGEDEPIDENIEQASSIAEALGFEAPERT